jgi:anti-sigma regulatory factor (Ser/Thr protein kinase)
VCAIVRDVTRTLANDARAAAAARRLVARAAAHGHVSARQREVAILPTSEAVTNAVVRGLRQLSDGKQVWFRT